MYQLKIIEVTDGFTVETIHQQDVKTKQAGYKAAAPFRSDYASRGYTEKVSYGSGWEMAQGSKTAMIYVTIK